MLVLILLMPIVFAVPIRYIPSTKIPPNERNFAVMDYFVAHNSLIVFSGGLTDGTYTNDLWEFTLNDTYWTQQIPTSSNIPGIS